MPLNDSFRKGGAANVVKLAAVPSSDDLVFSLANAQKTLRKPVFMAWQVNDEKRLLSVTCGMNPTKGDARWVLRNGQELNSPVIWSHDTTDALMIHTLVSDSLSETGPSAEIPEFLRPGYVEPGLEPVEEKPAADKDYTSESPGSVFADRYEVIAEIGKGATSTVYTAKQVQIKRIVALKLMHSHLVADENNKRRFEQEAKATAALSHPNLVLVHDFGTSPLGRPFIVMDFVDGPSLDAIITEQGRLNSHQFVEVFVQCCRGLAHAHKKGVIHRDIKPSNIRLYKDDHDQIIAKILDFGIAKVLTQEEDALLKTEVGAVVGSPAFMSPEQSRAENVDHRTDIYSLGIVMFHAATGVLPFKGKDIFETLYKQIYEKPPSFASLNLKFRIPDAVESMIQKALEKDVSRRYQTMEELQRDLMQVLSARASTPAAEPVNTLPGLAEMKWQPMNSSQFGMPQNMPRQFNSSSNDIGARQNISDQQNNSVGVHDNAPSVQDAVNVAQTETTQHVGFTPEYINARNSDLADGGAGIRNANSHLETDGTSAGAQQHKESITELNLLLAAKLVTDGDITRVVEVASRLGGQPSAMLIADGKIDRALLEVAKRCTVLINGNALDIGRAVILLNYSQRSRLDFDKAVEELGWTLE